MATIPSAQTSFFNMPLSIQRLNPRPLDSTGFWGSLDEAKSYAVSGSTAYVGQIMSVFDEASATAKAYIISNQNGVLNSIGALEFDVENGYYIINNNARTKGFHVIDKYLKIGNAKLDYNPTQNLLDIDVKIHGTNGFTFTENNTEIFSSVQTENGVKIVSGVNLSLNNSDLQINNHSVLHLSNKQLNIGNQSLSTNLISDVYLGSGIFTENGKQILSKYGDGNFAKTFQASYENGDVLMSTYNDGVLISNRLSIGNINNYFLLNNKTLELHLQDSSLNIMSDRSQSLYATHIGRDWKDFNITPDTDFVVFGKPTEAVGSIGISGSKTRLYDKGLFLHNNRYIESVDIGIKVVGDMIFSDSISSLSFSSGFAGSGWGVLHSPMTGSFSATFDELTIRKKMRIYELEVQSTRCTNGSSWISDSCKGDYVEEII